MQRGGRPGPAHPPARSLFGEVTHTTGICPQMSDKKLWCDDDLLHRRLSGRFLALLLPLGNLFQALYLLDIKADQ